jgi:hypothetical protein
VAESVATQMKKWNIPERLKNKLLGQ